LPTRHSGKLNTTTKPFGCSPDGFDIKKEDSPIKNLNKYERETSILWNQSDDPISIWTYDSKLKNRLRKFARKHPDLCRIEKDTKGFVAAEVEKSRVSVHLNSPQSDERRRKSSERALMNLPVSSCTQK